jgi:hypothetical protein
MDTGADTSGKRWRIENSTFQGFGAGIALTNNVSFVIDNVWCSSNRFAQCRLVRADSGLVQNSFFTGCAAPGPADDLAALVLEQAPNGAGLTVTVMNCEFGDFTKAIWNNNSPLSIIGANFERPRGTNIFYATGGAAVNFASGLQWGTSTMGSSNGQYSIFYSDDYATWTVNGARGISGTNTAANGSPHLFMAAAADRAIFTNYCMPTIIGTRIATGDAKPELILNGTEGFQIPALGYWTGQGASDAAATNWGMAMPIVRAEAHYLITPPNQFSYESPAPFSIQNCVKIGTNYGQLANGFPKGAGLTRFRTTITVQPETTVTNMTAYATVYAWRAVGTGTADNQYEMTLGPMTNGYLYSASVTNTFSDDTTPRRYRLYLHGASGNVISALTNYVYLVGWDVTAIP